MTETTICLIPLSKGKFARVDAEDYDRLMQYKWFANHNKKTGQWRAIRNYSRKLKKNQRGSCYMHREIMQPPKGMDVDHIDGDGLNNCRDNLRVVTHQQNMFNIRSRKNNSSGFKGVCWDKHNGSWFAQIAPRGKHIWLGRFDDKIEAAKAYDGAALEHFGEFAGLNFPDDVRAGKKLPASVESPISNEIEVIA